MSPGSLVELAEMASAHRVPGAGVERLHRHGFALVREPVSSTATNSAHVTALTDVDAAMSEVRRWFRDRRCDTFTWWIGSSTVPRDTVDQLLSRGARPYDPEPVLCAMVLDREPAGPEDVDVRVVESLDDFVRAIDVQCRAFAVPDEERRQALSRAAERWGEQAATNSRRYLAYADGVAVGMAGMERLETGHAFLLSGCVLPEARGQGVYRALVRRRWLDAQAAGWLPLIVQAGQMSTPILQRCGFAAVGEIHLLADRAATARE